MTRTSPPAGSNKPVVIRKSQRATKPRKTFGNMVDSDKHLKHLRRGIFYKDSRTTQSKDDEAVGCSRDVHGEGWVEPDARMKKAQDVFYSFLQPRGWTYGKARGLGDYKFYAPGFNAGTATKGITVFTSYKALATKLDECNVNDIIVRAQEEAEKKKAASNVISNNVAPAAAPPTTVTVKRQQVASTAWSQLVQDESTDDDTVAFNTPPVIEVFDGDDEESSSSNGSEFAREQIAEVSKWLAEKLPHLSVRHVEEYSKRLVEIGFDNVPMLENELWVQHQEANVLEVAIKMKDAHKRVLLRAIAKDGNGSIYL